MKKTLATTLLIGALSVSAAAAAEAHTPSASATCASVKVNLSSYQTNGADKTPNTVTVTLDGVQTSSKFGASYSATIPFAVAAKHTYSVSVIAFDDPTGSKGFTKTVATGEVTNCVAPEPSPSPTEPVATIPPNEPVVPIKGATPTPNTTPTDHPEPGVETPYPAPVVTPNTVNGVPPVSVQPTPAPTTVTDMVPVQLANTGANDLLFVWGGIGVLALLAGIASVIHAQRKA